MWIFLRDSFLSVEQHEDEPRLLQVRARLRGDIERVFAEAVVAEVPRDDYRFCASISRDRVAHVMSLRLHQIDYSSLNDRVHESDRYIPYDRVYGVMLNEQTERYGSELDLPGYVPSYDLDEMAVEASLLAEPLAEA